MNVNVFNREQLIIRGGNADEVLISISSPRQDYETDVPILLFGSSLMLRFDDATEKHQDFFVLFTEEDAKSVCDFIEQHAGKKFVIHCDAGISRSVAIGAFIRDFYGLECKFHAIETDQCRNVLVYNLLRREKMKRNGIKFE